MVIRGYPTVLISCLMIIFFHFPSVVKSMYNIPLAPALYVFGDSLLDSGNNNRLLTLAKANIKPYGANFPQGATGRFTNGRTVADFIAEYLRLPYSPPYLSFEKSAAVTTGLNYASAACGILPKTGQHLGKCLSLVDQIALFQKTVGEELPKHYESAERLSDHLSKSIFLISIGSNDYMNNYLQLMKITLSSQLYSPQSFSELLINNLSQQLQRLHTLGVRKMVVFEIGPIGCIPSITGQYNHSGAQCVEEFNQFVDLFNTQLGIMLKHLTSTLQGSSFVLGRINSLAYNAIINPSNYGFVDSEKPCCKIVAAKIGTCVPALRSCDNVDEHFFWDGYHLTEAAYSLTAQGCIGDSKVCAPMNIQQLVQV